MERRKQDRIAHRFISEVPVTFSGKAKGGGTLYDLSAAGCKVASRTTPPLGATITLRLALSYHSTPITIDAAIVGWTIKDQYFGVKFVEIKSSEQAALERYIASLHEIGVATAF
jgi:c-di-GMP-binding flagellar brake protein YcgR